MLVCKQCGSNRVFGIIPDALRLEVQMERVGDITEKLMREAGLWKAPDPKIRRMVVAEQVNYEDISLASVTQFLCKGCNRVAEADGFDNLNHCRCGTRTDDVFLCAKHLFITCSRCFERPMCGDCKVVKCILNPKNKSGGYAEVFKDVSEEDWLDEELIEDGEAIEPIAFMEDEPSPPEGVRTSRRGEPPPTWTIAPIGTLDSASSAPTPTIRINTDAGESLSQVIRESRRERRRQAQE